MLFGQYLIHVGALTATDVLSALDEQENRIERFGRIAIKLGYLDASRLLTILDEQITKKKKVGEIAIILNLMTQDQVTHVLTVQKKQRKPIGLLLVERGALDEECLRKRLADYFQENPESCRYPSTMLKQAEAVVRDDKVK